MTPTHDIAPAAASHAYILVLNAGSNSLKYKLFRGEVELLAGHIDGIGKPAKVTIKRGVTQTTHEHPIRDYLDAVTYALATVSDSMRASDVAYVLHRVVHGGERYPEHIVITDTVELGIEDLATLAPLHNPANLACIRAARKAMPRAIHIAFFDTAFHHTIPKHAFLYGLPYTLYEKWGIRKYGFHGLSHQYASEFVYQKTGHQERLITCHLGSGSSLAAIHHGKSFDTTMGFTPLDGLLMGTRSGEIDPEIPLFLIEHEKLSTKEVTQLLNKESGIKGLVGTSDLREVKKLADEGNAHAILAIEMLAYRVAQAIGSYHVTVGGAHVITFTGGIGEHADYVRAKICERLAPLGVLLDPQANAKGSEVISAPSSRVLVMVLEANEELHMVRLLQRSMYTLE